jgi:hypothetical protein
VADIDEFSTRAGGAGRAGLIGLLVPALAAGGLLFGFAGGAAGLVGGGAKTEVAPLTPVSVFGCPGGAPVGTLHRGDRVFVTGRDKTGDYLQIRDLTDITARVWVASNVVGAGQVQHVQVAAYEEGCQREVVGAPHPVGPLGETPSSVVAETTAVPGIVTTSTSAGGTARTTAPGATTSPTGAPVTTTPGTTTSTGVSGTTVTTTPGSTTTTAADNAPPAISGTSATPKEIWESYPSAGGTCSSQTTTVVSAQVSDASGLSAVTMSWSIGKVNGSSAMSPSGGSYRATLGSFPYHTVPDGKVGQIAVTVTATDTRGNTSTASTTVPLHSASECAIP